MTAEYLVSSGAPAQLTPGAYEARLIENSDASLPREKTSMAESHREQHCSRPTPKANRTATSPAGLIASSTLLICGYGSPSDERSPPPRPVPFASNTSSTAAQPENIRGPSFAGPTRPSAGRPTFGARSPI